NGFRAASGCQGLHGTPPWGIWSRHHQSERAAFSRFALHAHGAVVRAHDKFHDTQAQAHAVAAARQAVVGLPKTLEDSLLISWRETDSVIVNGETDGLALAVSAQADFLLPGCVFVRVVEQVQQRGD